MSAHRIPLPQPPVLAREYQQDGVSYRTLGDRYGCSASTIQKRLKAWALRTGKDWPLKTEVKPSYDSVDPTLVRNEIAYAVRVLRVDQKTLARAAGVHVSHLHKITGNFVPRILRSTQGKILEAICQIEAGEIVLDGDGKVALPLRERTHCPNQHPYGEARNPRTGNRICLDCRTEKGQRQAARRRAARAAARAS